MIINEKDFLKKVKHTLGEQSEENQIMTRRHEYYNPENIDIIEFKSKIYSILDSCNLDIQYPATRTCKPLIMPGKEILSDDNFSLPQELSKSDSAKGGCAKSILVDDLKSKFGISNILTPEFNDKLQKIHSVMKSSPSGEIYTQYINHRPIEETSPPTSSSLDVIKSRVNAVMSENQWQNIKNGVSGNTKAVVMSQLSKAIVNEMPFISINNNLAVYKKPCWRYIDFPGFVAFVRNNFWEHQDVIDSLSESNFRELMLKVKTTPKIMKKADEISSPSWYINFIDGVYDINTGQYIKQSPDHYFFNYIDVSIHEIGRGNGKYFEYYMKLASGEDEAIYSLILEMLGIIISSKMIKGFFLLLGPPDSGKTQLALLIKILLGYDNVAVVPGLNSFKKPHTTSVLKGKKACLCMDLARSCIDEESLSIIKQITGKDPISIEKKFCDIEMLENTAKLILGANLLPSVNDPIRNDAYFRRMKIIPFRYSVPPDKQIPDIAEKMAEERGYIVAKALEALNGLQKRNYEFTEVNTEIDEYGAILSSKKRPVELFFEECCLIIPEGITFTEELFCAFQLYCKRNNQTCQSKISFSQEFSKLAQNLEKVHTSRNGKTLNGYRGLQVKEDYLYE